MSDFDISRSRLFPALNSCDDSFNILDMHSESNNMAEGAISTLLDPVDCFYDILYEESNHMSSHLQKEMILGSPALPPGGDPVLSVGSTDYWFWEQARSESPDSQPSEQERLHTDCSTSTHKLTKEFLETSGYFDMSIKQAAEELKMGMTSLKKLCRQLGLSRWPYRMRQSLQRLSESVKSYNAEGLIDESEATTVEKHKKSQLLESRTIPQDLKRVRQKIFKLDHRKRNKRA